MPLRVLNDRVLVKPDPDEYLDSNREVRRILNEGLLVAPEQYEGAVKKIAMRGEVVSWGNGCKYEYKISDRVIFGRFSGSTYYIGEVKHILLLEEELHAKEEND